MLSRSTSSAILLSFLLLLTQNSVSFEQERLDKNDNSNQIIFQSSSLQQDPQSNPLQSISDQDLFLLESHVQAYPDKRLIRWADGHQEWLTEGQKALIILQEGRRRFVDVTDQDHQHAFTNLQQFDTKNLDTFNSFPDKINLGLKSISHLFDKIQISRMKARLAKFSGFKTRYYRSETGRKSQAWLLNEIRNLVSKSSSNVTISEFSHHWGQNTIIARFEPNPKSNITDIANAETFIIGAHQDSTNLLPFLPAPGADDDGSGTTSILEAFDILLQHNWTPSPNTGAVEFMWFSAEEGGLLGSQGVAKSYKASERRVSGMVQFDMTAFVKEGTTPSVGLVTDFVDPALTQYLRLLIDEYLSIGWVNTKCGYACSDHASWININVPSAFAIESKFEDSNQKIHSTGDTIHQPEFSFEHMAEFSKLILGLIVELKGL